MIRTAEELNAYLRGLCKVAEPSVDRILAGDPNTPIKAVGTCWMASFDLIRKAYRDGVNVIVCHEPAFYSYLDLDEHDKEYDWVRRYHGRSTASEAYAALVAEKERWILEHNMALIRCHDVLDSVPAFGIPFALGHALGFDNADILRSETYFNVYRVPEQSARELAKHLAKKLKPLGQPGIAFYGDGARTVKSIAVGTGCYSDPIQLMDLHADFYVTVDDSIRTWVQTAFSRDSGLPLAVINHGTSEEPGVQALAGRIRTDTALPVRHYPCGCSYEWITENHHSEQI